MDNRLPTPIEVSMNAILDSLMSKSEQLVSSAPAGVRGAWWVQFRGLHALQNCKEPLAFFISQEVVDTMDHADTTTLCNAYHLLTSCLIVVSVKMRKSQDVSTVDSWVIPRLVHRSAQRGMVSSFNVHITQVSDNPALIMARMGSNPGGGCAACGAQNTPLRRCGRCKVTAYCGVSCQKAHWQSHKLRDCLFFKRLRKTSKRKLRRVEREENR
jgi:hypothetical protein